MRRENATVASREKAHNLDRLVRNRKTDFRLFVQLWIVGVVVTFIAEDVKRGLCYMTLEQEGEGLIDVDAALDGKKQ